MTQQQRILVIAVFVVAVIGGILAVAVIGGGGSPGPSSVASASATSTLAPATPTVAPTPAPTPGTTPTLAPSATPTPTTAPGPAATIILTQLKLDATDDPEGSDRVVTFTTGGTGAITITLKTLSPMGSARMCLNADGTDLGCQTTAEGSLAAETTKKAATFELTLRGNGIETPVVEVSVTFPAASPSVTVADARFDGTGYPETNGIQAVVQPRADGGVHVTADWGGHPFIWELDLLEQGGSGSQTLANQGPATRMDETLPVTAPNPWKVVLQNTEMGFGPTPMTVTIAWP
jgi:hypothetical protein